MQATRVQSLTAEGPLEKGMVTHSSILAWEMDRGAWQATVHGAAKGLTRLSDCAHTRGIWYLSSPNRDGTHTLCNGRRKSQPLDRHGAWLHRKIDRIAR